MRDVEWRQASRSVLLEAAIMTDDTTNPRPRPTYELFAEAITGRKQIHCVYDGYPREFCPIILGHTDGQEKALTYQVGGKGKSKRPCGRGWRCLWLSEVSDAQLRDGPGLPAPATRSRRAASRSSIST
jgi:hypothetical protein